MCSHHPPSRHALRSLGLLVCGFIPAVLVAADLPLRSLEPPVHLPDGKEFRTWETTAEFSRTYHVDGNAPGASDDNPGTADRPFATVNRAAQVLQPGERVVVAKGIYRERIKPARGGESPSRLISYEAEPGATVILKGSRVFEEPWQRDAGASRWAIWTARLQPRYFDGYNPFAIDNVTPAQFEGMEWAAPLRGKTPYTLPRGLVFQNGRRLVQVARREDLTDHAGSFWVDRAAQTLSVRGFDPTPPRDSLFEITTQETVFAPETPGLGFIRVQGFTFEHAAGPFPWEQVGALSTTRGHHWIIEDNLVHSVNGVGIDIGIQTPSWPQPPTVGFHIVRGNTVTDCGICGIAGLGPGGNRVFGLLIEDNVLLRNAFHDTERLFETAGLKTHMNVECLIRHNLIVDTLHGAGLWMDWDNRNSRCSQNLIIGSRTMHGGLFIEASQVPNLVDQNIIWDTQGHGIYEHDCTRQIFAHNLVGRSTGSGFHLHGKMTDRAIDGRQPDYGRHEVRNNVLVENAKPDFMGGQPSLVSGQLTNRIQASLSRDPFQLALKIEDPAALARAPVAQVDHDFFNHARLPSANPAGPFGQVWPLGGPRLLWPKPRPARAVPTPAVIPQGSVEPGSPKPSSTPQTP